MFQGIDALVLPTMPTIYTVDEVLADPIALNSRLGTYTNFVNLLDLCALAVPASMRADGAPAGITFIAPAGQDAALASIGRAFHADTNLPLGATGRAQPQLANSVIALRTGEVALAVVGAHLSGMPLNGELRALAARLIAETLRVADGQGATIVVELWALRTEAFGTFVAAVPPPLSIGTVRLADGSVAKGFLVEAKAVEGARDISGYGGWRAFIAEQR
jgi:allophanate hydrolase